MTDIDNSKQKISKWKIVSLVLINILIGSIVPIGLAKTADHIIVITICLLIVLYCIFLFVFITRNLTRNGKIKLLVISIIIPILSSAAIGWYFVMNYIL